jgi:Ca-activated chloride channel family protein
LYWSIILVPMRVGVLFLLLVTAAVPDTFRASSSLVLVNVSVLDAHDRPVTTLAREHFRVLDDGREQDIRFFAHEDAPISLAIILDTSGSMQRHWNHARQMLSDFCRALEPGDELFLVTVGQRARVATGFSHDCAEIQNSLLTERPKGLTPLLDAFPPAFRQLHQARNPRRAVLAISDGGENASRTRFAELRSLAREANAQVYSATLERFGHAESDGPDFLSDLAELTGGRSFPIDERRSIEAAATAIAREIHVQYVLGYQPPDARGDGKYHRISIKVERNQGQRLSLFYRRGYHSLSTPDATSNPVRVLLPGRTARTN